MKKLYIIIILALIKFPASALSSHGDSTPDTTQIIKLDKQGFDSRMTNSEQTIRYAGRALAMAKNIDYKDGIAESYRVMGVGYFYLNRTKDAIDSYLAALDYFTQANDLRGEGKVYNNIGCLYIDNDYEASLHYLNESLAIAQKLSDKHLMTSLYMNLGNVHYRQKSYYQALNYYDKSSELFAILKDSANMVQCLENKGVIYYNLNQFATAEQLLIEANKEAKKLDLNEPIAGTDLTLAALYIAESKFNEAEKTVQEGEAFSEIIKDDKLLSDFKYTSYQLEFKRKNYEGAVSALYEIYHKDSTSLKQNTSNEITLIKEQANQQAKQKENEILLQRQNYDRVKFWGVTVVAGLLLFLVGLLISNVKRKAKTNVQLTNLNAEVSRQKDNLDRINHHLEEIIDERTKDLQVKNKKLSEYSSYLSHQIRGPIATLKGLLNLEKEGLVDQRECIRMMNKSVSEIDDKIIEMSDMLHDPGRAGF
ncbi:MAG TPA: tetratricopeptide repeat protein [Mucilaginibacter sp.]|jgi:tetratricopeptide (TPR) repeat protein|nr:tetratricopeptide repeat protein [Mucilaginibacter sp.]